MARTYTDDEKAAAIDLTVHVGPTEAGSRLGIPKSTLANWLTPDQQAEMAERSTAKTRAATEAHSRRWAEVRAAMVDDAGDCARRLLAVLADNVDSLVPRSARDAKDLATAMAILIDKAQLLSGDATSRPAMPWDRDEVVADATVRAEGLRVINGGEALAG